jgi:energy-coupling factor transport system permease protein
MEPEDGALLSPLGRRSPLAKLLVALLWLVGLATTLDPRPPAVLAVVAVLSGLALGAIPPRRFLVRAAPLLLAALAIGAFNALFSGDPLRPTEEGLRAGLGIGLRVLAIAAVGLVFALTTDATRLIDALVQVARVPERFAYGALAAYQAIPVLGGDLVAFRQARRTRGLSGGWHPGMLVGLLVMAIRHADRLALAMDARAFGVGPRTAYRQERWTVADTALLIAATAILVAALLTARLPLPR